MVSENQGPHPTDEVQRNEEANRFSKDRDLLMETFARHGTKPLGRRHDFSSVSREKFKEPQLVPPPTTIPNLPPSERRQSRTIHGGPYANMMTELLAHKDVPTPAPPRVPQHAERDLDMEARRFEAKELLLNKQLACHVAKPTGISCSPRPNGKFEVLQESNIEKKHENECKRQVDADSFSSKSFRIFENYVANGYKEFQHRGKATNIIQSGRQGPVLTPLPPIASEEESVEPLYPTGFQEHRHRQLQAIEVASTNAGFNFSKQLLKQACGRKAPLPPNANDENPQAQRGVIMGFPSMSKAIISGPTSGIRINRDAYPNIASYLLPLANPHVEIAPYLAGLEPRPPPGRGNHM